MDKDFEDSFCVCARCKWERSTFDDNTVCNKRMRMNTTPHGVSEIYYRVTWQALKEFRAENNGRCPYFEEKFSWSGFIRSIFKRGQNGH